MPVATAAREARLILVSEFSDSFHVRATPDALERCDDASRLIIVAHRAPWTTFLYRDVGFQGATSLRGVPGLVLRHIYAADHGWSTTLYNAGVLIFEHAVDWDPELRPARRKGRLARFASLLEVDPFETQRHLPTGDIAFEDALEQGPAFAVFLGLPRHAWVSSERVTRIESCDACGLSSPGHAGWTCPACGYR